MTDERDPVVPQLDGVPVTALITLYARGTEAARADAVLRDDLAVRTLRRLDFPFAEQFGPADQHPVVRALQFDRVVRRFLAVHPDAPVVSLGEGLETQLWRVDDGRVPWTSVDLPDMIALRRRLLPPHPRNRLIAASALDPDWIADATGGEPALVIAQGLLMYFERDVVAGFLRMLAERCPGSTLVFDTIPGWAATDAGHLNRRTGYRMPPEPWGTGRRGLARLLVENGLVDVRRVPPASGRGFAWGRLYPAAVRVLRGGLPMTVVARIPVP